MNISAISYPENHATVAMSRTGGSMLSLEEVNSRSKYFQNSWDPKPVLFFACEIWNGKIDKFSLIQKDELPYLSFDFDVGQNTNAAAPITAAPVTMAKGHVRFIERNWRWKKRKTNLRIRNSCNRQEAKACWTPQTPHSPITSFSDSILNNY